jgi:hypothetical protein
VYSVEADGGGNAQPKNKPKNTSMHSKGARAERKAQAGGENVESGNNNAENQSDLRTIRHITSNQQQEQTRRSTAKDRARVGRSTLMFFTLTMTYYVSYIPYFTIFILRYTGQLNLDEVSY